MNGNWKTIALMLISLFVGTLGSSGYMSCQYQALAEDLKQHKEIVNEERVDLEGRLRSIETILEDIREDLRK